MKYLDIRSIKLIFPYLKPYKRKIVMSSILIFIGSLLTFPSPFITRHIIDYSIPKGDWGDLKTWIIIIIVIITISSIVSYISGVVFNHVNFNVIYMIRKDLLDKISKAPRSYTKAYGSGYLISRINDDTNRIKSLLIDNLVMITKDALRFVLAFISIYLISVKLALLTTVFLPIIVLIMFHFNKLIASLSKKLFESDSITTQTLNNSLNSIELSKLYCRYDYTIGKYCESSSITRDFSIKLANTMCMNSSVCGEVLNLVPIGIILLGGYLVMKGSLSLGSIIAFNSLTATIFYPINNFINFSMNLQKALVSLSRINEILTMEDETKLDSKNEFLITNTQIDDIKIDTIEVENIKFSYDTQLVLKGISFKINRGERIGLVGLSGSGKSTIIKILSGLYPADSGNLIVNNHILSKSEIISFRKKIAVVEQEPILLNDTIYNNILYGNPKASYEDVVRVAQMANIHDFITKMKDGYDTLVGNNGVDVSIGQKQRLAIARALIKNPELLLLDEITSNVDNISEKYITNTIFSLPKDMIVIIIAHRLNVVKDCSNIILINEGNIEAIGTHNTLVNSNEIYRKLNESNK